MALVCDQQDPKRPDCPYCQSGDLYGQCTDGMWHWTSDNGASPKLPGAMGNAAQWVDYAHGAGWTVDMNPAVGKLVCYSGAIGGGAGHIAAVTEVNGQKIKVIEMNWKYKAPSGIADCREDGPGSADDNSHAWLGFITVPGVTPGASGSTAGGGAGLDLSGISKALEQVGAEMEAAAKNAENKAVSSLQMLGGTVIMGAGGFLLLHHTGLPQKASNKVRSTFGGAAEVGGGVLLGRVTGGRMTKLPTKLTGTERSWISQSTYNKLRRSQPPIRQGARPGARSGGMGRTGQVPLSPSVPPGRVPRPGEEQPFSGTPGARAAQTRAERQSARESIAYMAGHARGQQAERGVRPSGKRATLRPTKRPKGRERIPF